MQSNLNVIMVSAWMLGDRMLSEHERYYGLGMDALVTMCSWNTNVVLVWAWMRGERRLLEHEGTRKLLSMVWAWMLWTAAGALGTRPLLWFGQRCTGDRMLL